MSCQLVLILCSANETPCVYMPRLRGCLCFSCRMTGWSFFLISGRGRGLGDHVTLRYVTLGLVYFCSDASIPLMDISGRFFKSSGFSCHFSCIQVIRYTATQNNVLPRPWCCIHDQDTELQKRSRAPQKNNTGLQRQKDGAAPSAATQY